jgi:hypothetical protein
MLIKKVANKSKKICPIKRKKTDVKRSVNKVTNRKVTSNRQRKKMVRRKGTSLSPSPYNQHPAITSNVKFF